MPWELGTVEQMKRPIDELAAGDVVVAFVRPGGRVNSVRGGPLEVASVEPTGGKWEGMPQMRIRAAKRSRAPRYANGATHAVVLRV